MYDYTEYRVLNDTIKICNSTDDYVRNIWKMRNNWVKKQMSFRGCNRCFYIQYYFASKELHVFWAPTVQYFSRNNYGVINGITCICKEKLRTISREFTKEDLLTCNDSIINIKYDDDYKVWNNFSILYKHKTYDYTEYRVLNDTIKICNSTDDYVRNVWKMRNNWVKRQMTSKGCNKCFYIQSYVVSKQFHVYRAPTGQYFSRNDYGVTNGKTCICKEKLGPISREFTKEDLLTCNDSIINIKYDDDYKVWNNFSILYKNKVYDYTEYRVLNDTTKICNSTDDYVRNVWKMRNKWVKGKMSFKECKCSYIRSYVVSKQFHVYWPPANQYFSRNEYRLFLDKICSCKEKLRPISTKYTKEDLLTCNDSIINIRYDDEYKVWNNFSLLYKNKVYDYTEYRVLNDTIKICNSTDDYVRDIWKLRNKWVKNFISFKSCNRSIITKTHKRGDFPLLKEVKLQETTIKVTIYKRGYKQGDFLLLKEVLPETTNYTYIDNTSFVETKNNNTLHKDIMPTEMTNTSMPSLNKAATKYSYGVFEGKFIICSDEHVNLDISDIEITFIAPFCALALSIICLLLLLIVYGMLPELRTLPGLNLMSLSFSFLLALINYAVYLSLYLRVGKELDFPCARLEITNKFITYNILMNAVVNIYHLRKTFYHNTLVRSDVNKLKTFFKYSLFGWGVPVVITIVYIVLVKTEVLRFHQNSTQRSVSCARDGKIPNWLVVAENYGVPGCLLLYIIAMFIFTAYRIREKLRVSDNIVRRSNIVKNRRNFVLLFKLLATTAISWIPLVFEDLVFNSDVMIALLTVAWLTGVYVGIAFVFTRKNYQLLKKKYFSEPESEYKISKTTQFSKH
ncbi:uncharacterized protein LOC114534865 [Dendronephthya gigantea]|uniref:uncharacterized protein LOC114534865 n=1 Tax=Dendronephthya gigantea TaxID=151771 RepID=UPI00106BAD43|nr:uncharacterized protein LOC114534865 [Dendronephthya gigantea]